MNGPQLLPLTGERFDELLDLVDPDRKTKAQATAWEVVQQQTQTYPGPSGTVDLNRIFLDMLRLELLVFPILEDWKSPLSQDEWNQIDQQAEEVDALLEKVRKLSILVRKKDPQGYAQFAELFNRFFAGNEQLRSNWSHFKEEWRVYKQQWELVNARRKRARERAEANRANETPDAAANTAATSSEDDMDDYPVAPPLFRRDQWLALRQMGIVLEAELRQRTASYQKTPLPPGFPHPALRHLVQELQQIFLRTQGFELLEKVQLVQQRNAQLIEEVQSLFPEPIISESMRSESEEERESSPLPPPPVTPPPPTNFKPLLFLFAGIGVVGLLVFLLMPLNPAPQKNPLKELKFEPKGNTLRARNVPDQGPQEIELRDTINHFGLNLEVRQNDSRLMALSHGNDRERSEAVKSFLSELGRDAAFAFAQAGSYFMFWKGQVKELLSIDELQQTLQRLKQQVDSLKRTATRLATPNSRIVPENLNGESVYALEVQSSEGETVQLYQNAEGVRLRMSNGEFLDEVLTPEQVNARLGLR